VVLLGLTGTGHAADAAAQGMSTPLETGSAREVLKKYGLFGRWSTKCGEYSSTEWVDGCPFRKLNPTILMMKSAQDVASDDAAAALNGPAIWGIFLQT
jgi:hypothetical protein